MNLPDPERTARTITITNPDLKPWTADSYSLALEYYFNEPSSRVLSTRVYRRDISDFFGTALQPATDDLLEPYGIGPAPMAKRSATSSAPRAMSAMRGSSGRSSITARTSPFCRRGRGASRSSPT